MHFLYPSPPWYSRLFGTFLFVYATRGRLAPRVSNGHIWKWEGIWVLMILGILSHRRSLKFPFFAGTVKYPCFSSKYFFSQIKYSIWWRCYRLFILQKNVVRPSKMSVGSLEKKMPIWEDMSIKTCFVAALPTAVEWNCYPSESLVDGLKTLQRLFGLYTAEQII